MKTTHPEGLHVGETAIAVPRPEKIVPAEAPVDSDATSASAGTPLGPTSCQLVVLAGGRLAMVAAASAAVRCCPAPIHFLG
jgi:hypothetical protein